MASRLLTAFGSHRELFQCSREALTFFGLAPVTEQSGKSKRVHFRWVVPNSCAHASVSSPPNRCAPALGQRASQRRRTHGKGHHAEVHALAYKWIRILYRCWQTRQPHNPGLYLSALLQRGSPYASPVNNSTQKGLTDHLRETRSSPLISLRNFGVGRCEQEGGALGQGHTPVRLVSIGSMICSASMFPSIKICSVWRDWKSDVPNPSPVRPRSGRTFCRKDKRVPFGLVARPL